MKLTGRALDTLYSVAALAAAREAAGHLRVLSVTCVVIRRSLRREVHF